MKQNERLDALHVLVKLLRDHIPLTHLMQTAQLTSFSKEICFGVCRYYYRLQALANCLLNKPPKDMEIWLTLLIGLYQLHYLRTPDYAVVQETVSLLDKIKKTWAKGFINAVLRTYCRQQEALALRLTDDLSFTYNHPEWFIHALQKTWPTQWQAILHANDIHPPMTLRVNRAHMTAPQYLERLQTSGIQAQLVKYAPQGIELETPCDVYDIPGFSDGEVSVQDQAAQLAVSLLALKPGLRLLDACCAPGGKTGHIAETEPNLSACLALDIDTKRLSRVRENLNRLHLHPTLIQGDALIPQTWWDGKHFDRILLDAPCSATGVIRRHPDIKLLRSKADVDNIVKLQQDLLHALWPLLAPGGRLVYATCSVMPEENEQQIARFIATKTDCQVLNNIVPWGQETGHGRQILPGENNMDGFFYSVLCKQ